MELQNVPAIITHLSEKLGYDPDIQTYVRNVGSKANAAASFFRSTVANQGSQVLAQKSSLMSSLSPNDVRITKMVSALTAAIEALTSNKQQVISLETDIHRNIETCRSRKTQHEMELKDKESKIDNLRSEIKNLEVRIAAHEDEASTMENSAAELDRRADEMRQEAKRKRESAEQGGIISAIVGGVLAPFTGGASLVIAGVAAGINAGINLNDASDCERNATRHRGEAEGKLGEAAEVLQKVAYVLQSSIRDIDKVLNVFQEMETVFTEASLQTDSFKIIQSAFAMQPHRLEARAQVYLNQLKEKWTHMETILLQHDAKTITC